MARCHSMNADWVVGAFRGSEDSQILPAVIELFEFCALICNGDTETLFLCLAARRGVLLVQFLFWGKYFDAFCKFWGGTKLDQSGWDAQWLTANPVGKQSRHEVPLLHLIFSLLLIEFCGSRNFSLFVACWRYLMVWRCQWRRVRLWLWLVPVDVVNLQ